MLNLLVAYPYFQESTRKILRPYKGQFRLLVDSGAYTAWRGGKPIDLDAYCRFLDSLEEFRPFDAIQLDVVRDIAATARNLEVMKSRGYDVLPVWTRGASWARLQELQAEHPYICIGGVAKGGGNLAFLDWLHTRGVSSRVHWLGITNPDLIRRHRPFSVDSSSWASAGMFGTAVYFQGWKSCKLHRSKASAREWFSARRYFESIGAPIPHRTVGVDWRNSNPPLWLHESRRPEHEAAGSMFFSLTCIAWVHFARRVERVLGTRVHFSGGSELDKILLADRWLSDRGVE